MSEYLQATFLKITLLVFMYSRLRNRGPTFINFGFGHTALIKEGESIVQNVSTLDYQINEHVRLFFFRKQSGLCVLI